MSKLNVAQTLYNSLAERAEENYLMNQHADNNPAELLTFRSMLNDIINEMPDYVAVELYNLLITKDERIKGVAITTIKEAFQTELREFTFDPDAHYIIEGMICHIFDGWSEVFEQVKSDEIFLENLISYIFD